MILVDHQIRDEVKSGHLRIDNFDETCLQPASYDLRIGPLIYSPVIPDKPIDISKNGGAYKISPYGFAVLMTHETLHIPPDMIGRFGLKSGLTRRGLFASTGPQVDPGFEGKLFVSILNLTPVSHVVGYKETFLSIEFNKLDNKPERTYDGPYQCKQDIGPEILDDLVRLEGLNLSQMQTQFSDLSQHVKEWSSLAGKFEEFLKEMNRQTSVLTELVKQIVGVRVSQQTIESVEVRRLDLKQAKNEILDLFRKRKRLFYSDIAEELQLDYGAVIKACKQLEKEGFIEGDKDERKRTKRLRKENLS